MKKIISVLLLIVLIFSLSACKKEENTSSEIDTAAQNDISSIGDSTENTTTSEENSTSTPSANTTPSNTTPSNSTPGKTEEPKPTAVAGEYTVTFDYGYDNKKTTAKSKNYKVAKPEDPKRSGYEFSGWYADDERWSFAGHMVTTNMTLTAKWNQECVSSEASTNGGTSTNGENLNYRYTGLLITEISEDSDLYGKAQKGDIITCVNGIDINDDNIIINIIKERKAGDKILLTIISSGGLEKRIEVELIASTANPSSAKLGVTYTFDRFLDFPVGDFDFPADE